MDGSDIERLRVRADATLRSTEPLNGFLRVIGGYVDQQGLEPGFFVTGSYENTEILINLLDLEPVAAEDLLHLSYRNPNSHVEEVASLPDSGSYGIVRMLHTIGDEFAEYADENGNINNFESRATVAVDGDTALTFTLESINCPDICDHCSNDDMYMEHNGLYNCDHGEIGETTIERYAAAIHNREIVGSDTQVWYELQSW